MNKIKLMKKGKRIMFFILFVILISVVGLCSAFIIISPGQMKPVLNEDGDVIQGSLSEKIFIEINGIEQGAFIRGENSANPVLLFLGGGPGLSTYFLFEDYPTGLEKHFTICCWDQRGSGISYNGNKEVIEKMTMDQLIEDTVEMTNYLRNRFGQEKIYLMGHSWGSFCGIRTAAEYPDLYHAYIGMSQIGNQLTSEQKAYTYMLEEYQTADNRKMIRKFASYPIDESKEILLSYMNSSLRDQAMHDLGVGTTHEMDSVITGIFLPVMRCRAFSPSEKINVWRSKRELSQFQQEIILQDLTVEVPALEVPVYFLSGIYDYTVCHSLSKDYFNELQAPVKGFYTFSHSAHSPLFEEPDQMLKVMAKDVLNGTVDLADRIH